MTRRGFELFSFRLNNNEGSISKKIGGRLVSAPTSSIVESAATLVLTTESIDSVDVTALTESERKRRTGLRAAAPTTDPLAGELWCAVETISRHEAAGRPSLPAIPGSPTGDENTFISLPGLLPGNRPVGDSLANPSRSFAAHYLAGHGPEPLP